MEITNHSDKDYLCQLNTISIPLMRIKFDYVILAASFKELLFMQKIMKTINKDTFSYINEQLGN